MSGSAARKKPPWGYQGGSVRERDRRVRRSEVDQSAGLQVLEAFGRAANSDRSTCGAACAADATDIGIDVAIGEPQRHGSRVDLLHNTKTPELVLELIPLLTSASGLALSNFSYSP